jgi:dihydropteroate synthase
MESNDSIFNNNFIIRCGSRLLDLSKPVVMGVLNITPDSFYDGGKFATIDDCLRQTEKMLSEGASIIDAGGQSTRPKAETLSAKDEIIRVIPVIKKIKQNFPEAIISIDTFYSDVAAEAVHSGAEIVNDISGGTLDNKMFETIGKMQTPYILMHMQGTPESMQKNPAYEDVVKEVTGFFQEKINLLRRENVKDILIDPGFGFGKTTEHNYRLLKNLHIFKIFGLPLMAGISRKSMVNRILKIGPEGALNGTSVLNLLALQQGVKVLRVHDVKEAVEVIQLFEYYQSV